MKIHHLNCGLLHAPPNPAASCHCLLLETKTGLILIDTGIGLHDILEPVKRVGQPAIDAAGFQFREDLTAIRQIEKMGYSSSAVTDIILTHGDPDHVGGLADFPETNIHISIEELEQTRSGNWRYSPAQFEHKPKWVTHGKTSFKWFGLEARSLPLQAEVFLVPLFGHTLGHCGVAVRNGEKWLLHVGDAYYLRVELSTDDHPVSQLSTIRAEDNSQRHASLASLRRLHQSHESEIEMFGYHDFTEFPEEGKR